MPYTGQVTITPGGGPLAASLEVGEEDLSIVPQGGDPVVLPLSDIDDLHDDDYTLRLTDHAGRRYDLSMLGKAYGQVVADVRKRRNETLLRDLLLTGVNPQDTFPGKLFAGGGHPSPVPVQIRLFEDLMVVVPERGLMFGVPFSFVEDVRFEEELYQTHVLTDDGTTYVFGHLKTRSEELPKELRRLLDRLAARTARTLAGLLPGVEPERVSRLAGLMRDGRAVQQRQVDAIDPSLWPRLEDAVVGTQALRESYERLRTMSPAGWTALGVKAVVTEQEESGGEAAPAWEAGGGDATDRQSRGESREDREAAMRMPGGMPPGGAAILEQMQGQMSQAAARAAAEAVEEAMAEHQAAVPAEAPAPAETQAEAAPDAAQEADRKTEVLWYFVPLSDGGRPLNAVAQEVTSEGGKATYVFRLMEPERFASLTGQALEEAVGAAIVRLNRALLTLNFRREPIYLTEDQITQGTYGRYRVALRKLDYLRWARDAFLGRAIHNETWEQQLLRAAAQA